MTSSLSVSPSKPIPFSKMQGIGNDFILIDRFEFSDEVSDWSKLSRAVNDRKFGIGGDGLILVEPGKDVPFRMRMFNPDGSESEMCGNGIRCFARLLSDRGRLPGHEALVETGAGVLAVKVCDDLQVEVDMGVAGLTRSQIGMVGDPDAQFISEPIPDSKYEGIAVSMGNPHLVIFMDDVDSIDLEKEGPVLENHPLFPARVNVHFVQVLDRTHLKQRTWERGAGVTLACGTGACATAVAAYISGRANDTVRVDLPGGALKIAIAPDFHVKMTGPAETVFTGQWTPTA